MNKIDPKVNAQALATLVAAIVTTFLVAKFPGLKDLADSVKPAIVIVAGVGIGWVVGYAKRGLDWAYRYVQDHETL
jgi:hypothetical protein